MNTNANYGFDLPLFHGTNTKFDTFFPNSHFGTRAQAEMRSGNKARIIPVMVRGKKFKRMKDVGHWDINVMKRLERQGYDGVVYLNRYEGIPLDQFERLTTNGIDPDSLPDVKFRKMIPSAEDSYIIFNPQNIKVI